MAAKPSKLTSEVHLDLGSQKITASGVGNEPFGILKGSQQLDASLWDHSL